MSALIAISLIDLSEKILLSYEVLNCGYTALQNYAGICLANCIYFIRQYILNNIFIFIPFLNNNQKVFQISVNHRSHDQKGKISPFVK